MRRINWHFAGILLLVVALAAAGSWGLYVFQSGRIAQSLLWQARKNHDDGRPELASTLAGQYLQFRPDDVDFIVEYADWRRERATGRKAWAGIAALYEKALRVDARNDAIRRKAAEAYLSIGQYVEALDHLERLLQSAPDDAELLTQTGLCLQATGKSDAAADHYQRAMRADPRYVQAYINAAGLQQNQLRNAEGAGDLLNRAVAANPDSPDARAALAGHLRRLRRFDEAAKQVNDGLARNPDNATLLLAASEIASSAGDLPQSRALLNRGCLAHPKDPRFFCTLGWQLLFDGRADLAAQKLRAGKQLNPDDPDILMLLCDVLAHDGQIAPLEEALAELQHAKAGPDKLQPRVQYVEARLLMCRGRFPEALEKLDNLRAVAIRMPLLYRQLNVLTAQCCRQLGNTAGELDAFKRLLDQDSNAGAMRLEYARTLAKSNRHAEALREFASVVTRPEVASQVVASVAETLVRCAKQNPTAWKQLQQTFDAFALSDLNANPTIALAELERVRNQPDRALTQLTRNINKLPRNPILHVERARLFELKFGSDQALAALQEGEQLAGDHVEIRIARAQVLAARLEKTDAVALGTLALNVEQFAADDRQRLLREIISGYRLLGESDSVERMLLRLGQIRPDDLACREDLVLLARRTGGVVRMHVTLAEIQAIEGKDGPAAQCLEAARLISNGTAPDLAAAEKRLNAVAAARPNDPAVPFLRGRIAELSGRETEAREQYRTAIQRRLLELPSEEWLLAVPTRKGSAAAAVLADVLASQISADSRRSVVIAALPLFDAQSRMVLANRLMAQCANENSVKQAWLGRLFARMGLSEQSDAVFRRLASAAPQSREGWLALLVERMTAGDPTKLEAALREVRQGLAPLEAELLIGRAYEAGKRFADAKIAFERAAALKADDPRAWRALASLAFLTGRSNDARTALESLARLPESTNADDIRWARRQLALQLATVPSLVDFQKAMALLDQNKMGAGWLPDDIRARALVLATQKGRQLGDGPRTARQEAIVLLESLQRNSARSADDLLLLAKLYRAENDTAKFQQACDRLATEYSGNFACMAFLAREALRGGDLPRCERLLPTLDRLGPGQLETATIRFSFHALAGDCDKARTCLVNYVSAGPTPDEQSHRAVQVGYYVGDFLQLYTLTDRPVNAAALRQFALEQLTKSRRGDAETLQRIVTLLAQSGQSDAALTVIRNNQANLPPEAVAAAQVAVLRQGRTTPQQVQAIAQSLRDAAQKAPGSLAVLVSLADFYQHTHDREKAIAAYRQVLARDPNNVVALNNLAWTLAADQPHSREALQLVQRAIDLAGPIDELLDTRSRILVVLGDAEAGLRDLTEAAGETPTTARLIELAALHRKTGQPEIADRVLERARRNSGAEAGLKIQESGTRSQDSGVRDQESGFRSQE